MTPARREYFLQVAPSETLQKFLKIVYMGHVKEKVICFIHLFDLYLGFSMGCFLVFPVLTSAQAYIYRSVCIIRMTYCVAGSRCLLTHLLSPIRQNTLTHSMLLEVGLTHRQAARDNRGLGFAVSQSPKAQEIC